MKYVEIQEYNSRQKAYMYSEGYSWEIPLEAAKQIISHLNLTVDDEFTTGGIGDTTTYKQYYL